nr:hypothetical protein [Tanacetum cinerariifolium]
MTPRRRYGYVRLYLYPTKKDFYENEGKFFAILIRKRDIRVVGVQLVSREIFEIGRDYETERYFFNSTPTGFGQQYGELFKGTGGHYSRDCPTGNSRRGGVGNACYNNGERGHYAKDYPT